MNSCLIQKSHIYSFTPILCVFAARVVVVISGTRTSENKEKLLAAITETKKRLNVNAKFITINIGRCHIVDALKITS